MSTRADNFNSLLAKGFQWSTDHQAYMLSGWHIRKAMEQLFAEVNLLNERFCGDVIRQKRVTPNPPFHDINSPSDGPITPVITSSSAGTNKRTDKPEPKFKNASDRVIYRLRHHSSAVDAPTHNAINHIRYLQRQLDKTKKALADATNKPTHTKKIPVSKRR